MIATEVKYKKTGIDWMPEVPEHWGVIRLKFLGSIRSGDSIVAQNFIETGKYEVYGGNGFMGYTNECNIFGNNIIIGRVGALCGNVRYVSEPKWITDNALIVKLKEDISYEFISFALESFNLNKLNTSSAQPLLTGSKVLNVYLPLPPQPEQKAIADFLDAQSAKITRFIQTKQRFIELLKEQRQSIITNAVTKGIDDGVKMKETVLGEIPEHWEVRRLKFLAEVNFSTVDKHSHKEEKQVRLCNYVDVYKHEYITNNFDFMIATATEAEIKRFTVEKGDVIITKDSETAADIAIPALVVEDLENVVCAYHLAHIKPNRELIESGFLFRLFQSKKINSHFEVAAKGVTRHGLSYDDINSVFLPYPPTLKEQQEIIKHIKTETRTLDIAISKAEREIELIKEYREAMIAEAVTGKMKL